MWKSNLWYNNMNKNNKIKTIFLLLIAVIFICGTVFILFVNSEDKNEQNGTIYVSRTPDKMVYFVGDIPNYDGLVITYETKNKKEEISFIDNEESLIITGFDSTRVNDMLEITIKYKELTTVFYIKIKEFPQATPVLVGIYLKTLPKTNYILGEILDTTGGILVKEYKDGTTIQTNLLNEYVYGFSKIEGPGNYELIVIYNEGGLSAETTYTITVEE